MKQNYYILFILLFAVLIGCNQRNKSGSDTVNTANENQITQTISAVDLHEKLMTYFSKDWMERESDPDIYPSFYGGSFIDNNGIFVVAVTGNREENKKNLIEILGTTNFNVESVQYSYRDMMLVMDDIDEFLIDQSIPNEHPIITHFAGAYPDVMDNRVKVILTEVNQSLISTFKRDISNSPLIVFEQGEIPELY